MKPPRVIALLAVLAAADVSTGNEPASRPAIRQPIPPPPVPPARKAPTELFRELLAASPAEREQKLASRTPTIRALIAAKLREFEALPPDQRELRLCVAELQFYLSPLLRAEPDARARLLTAAPVGVRPLLTERLRSWDALDTDQRRDLLDSEQSLARFVRLDTTDPRALTNALAQVPAPQRAEAEAQLARWLALAPEERARKTAGFRRFFELGAGEQEKVLGMISAAERTQMEQTLARFSQLPPEQRERAERGFRKFLGMTAAERDEFLQNAAKWRAMTPNEREAWRRLVERAAIPLPVPPKRTWDPQLVMTNEPGR